MAFTCGFFNSVKGDRKYNSRQMTQLFDGLITDGVFAHYGTHFNISPIGNMGINVGSGRLWFNHVWGLNDGNLVLTLAPSDIANSRVDAIVVDIDESDEVRNAIITFVTGVPGSGKPTMINTKTRHQYPFAYVTVPADSTSISESNIQVVIGTSECPFVTGILENVNIDNLFDQWDDEFRKWFDDLKVLLNDNVVANLQNQINSLNATKASKDVVGKFLYVKGQEVYPVGYDDNDPPFVNIRNVSKFEGNDTYSQMYIPFKNGNIIMFLKYSSGSSTVHAEMIQPGIPTTRKNLFSYNLSDASAISIYKKGTFITDDLCGVSYTTSGNNIFLVLNRYNGTIIKRISSVTSLYNRIIGYIDPYIYILHNDSGANTTTTIYRVSKNIPSPPDDDLVKVTEFTKVKNSNVTTGPGMSVIYSQSGYYKQITLQPNGTFSTTTLYGASPSDHSHYVSSTLTESALLNVIFLDTNLGIYYAHSNSDDKTHVYSLYGNTFIDLFICSSSIRYVGTCQENGNPKYHILIDGSNKWYAKISTIGQLVAKGSFSNSSNFSSISTYNNTVPFAIADNQYLASYSKYDTNKFILYHTTNGDVVSKPLPKYIVHSDFGMNVYSPTWIPVALKNGNLIFDTKNSDGTYTLYITDLMFNSSTDPQGHNAMRVQAYIQNYFGPNP